MANDRSAEREGGRGVRAAGGHPYMKVYEPQVSLKHKPGEAVPFSTTPTPPPQQSHWTTSQLPRTCPSVPHAGLS